MTDCWCGRKGYECDDHFNCGGESMSTFRATEMSLEKLLTLASHSYQDSYSSEMYIRLRKLYDEVNEVESMENGHGNPHPYIFIERLRIILNGKN